MSTNAHPTNVKASYLYSDPSDEREAEAVALQFGERGKVHELTVHITRADVARLAYMLEAWIEKDNNRLSRSEIVASFALNDQYAQV